MNYLYNKLSASVFILLALVSQTKAQSIQKSDDDIINSLQQNISYLSDEKLEGRLMGSRGEKMAYEFLVDNFQSLGFVAKGTNGSFIQTFSLNKLSYNNVNFSIKKKSYEQVFKGLNPIEFYPLTQSNIGKIKGKTIWLGLGEAADYVNKKNIDGKIFVIKLGAPNISTKPLEDRIDTAIKLGAEAIVIVNQYQDILEPEFKPFFKPNFRKVPVYLFTHKTKIDTLNFDNATVELNIDTVTRSLEGHNVIAYINNKAPNTVVIGAHYDHLGYNELGGSTYRRTENEKPQIHNGADDNASGTAALIELAEIIKKANLRKNNYLFIAFSGEEEGLLGSNYFVKNPTIDISKVNYMINMDMVGRLDSTKNTFSINGVGTSPIWREALRVVNVKGLNAPITTESGSGASDHTSFYNMDIPVLHFFTGSHYDYHKPSDDHDLINYKGEMNIIKYIYQLVYNLEKVDKLTFTKTKDTDHSGTASSFKVTLGIMPDYLYEGKGIKIDGVTEGKPAANAGLKKGDNIVKLGSYTIADMTSYMETLGKFNKGDKTTITYIRDGKTIEANVTF
ncbi:MAG: M20/M25/M40 family metallo-hydrolase [Bacteroidota bacterium]